MGHAATASLMRRLNRSAILNVLRTHSPISRTEIARLLGMSLPTVMRVVDELIEEDLVHFEGSEPSGGRRRPLLQFNGAAYAVVGVDLGGGKLYGTVADLTGRIQHEQYARWEDYHTPPGMLSSLYHFIQALLDAPRPPGQRIRGIGVGAPGVTLADSGVVVWAPSLNWRDLPLKELLSQRFDPPIFVENDVNLAALGEYGFGIGIGVSNLVCLYIGIGIGAGILIEGKLYRGHNQAAGEVGYFPPGIDWLGRAYEEYGALEYFASGGSIVTRAREYLQKNNLSLASTIMSAEDVFDLAREGTEWAQEIISEAVDYLSMMIAGVCSLLDPEMIILSGWVLRSADLLIEPIMKRLKGVVPYVPRIVASSLGQRAGVMGAIVLVLDATTGQVMIDQRV